MSLLDQAVGVVRALLANHSYMLVRYGGAAGRKRKMERVTAVGRQRRLLLNHAEACQLINAVEATAHVDGDLAEVGVFDGASARLVLDHAPKHKILHLFDTFEGLPDIDDIDARRFRKGDFPGSVESVRRYLGDVERVALHPGLFPATAAVVEDRRFSCVHLDADLYSSTMAGLEFFYPRLSRGGILLCHDYVSAEGVNQAIRLFFTDKPEPVIELIGYQALIVKV
jgi:O-methyltransferase